MHNKKCLALVENFVLTISVLPRSIKGGANKVFSGQDCGTHTTHLSPEVKHVVVSKHFSPRSIALGDVAAVFSLARCSARYSLCGKPKM